MPRHMPFSLEGEGNSTGGVFTSRIHLRVIVGGLVLGAAAASSFFLGVSRGRQLERRRQAAAATTSCSEPRSALSASTEEPLVPDAQTHQASLRRSSSAASRTEGASLVKIVEPDSTERHEQQLLANPDSMLSRASAESSSTPIPLVPASGGSVNLLTSFLYGSGSNNRNSPHGDALGSSNATLRRVGSVRRSSNPRSVTGFTRLTSNIGDEEGPINSSGLLTSLPRKPVWRVALTGGPCSGKSTSVAIIKEELTRLGFRVFLVPEVATILISGGLDFACMTKEKRLMQQQVILQTIMTLEDGFYELASFDPSSPSVLLCDRGTMDGRAYCTHDEWKELLRNSDSTEEEIRDTRYDAVIHLVTTAIGAEEHYTLTNNAARSEGVEEAAALDTRTLNAWIGHKTIAVIENKKGEGFDKKVGRCTSFMRKLVGAESVTCVAPLPWRGRVVGDTAPVVEEEMVFDVNDPAMATGCYCLVQRVDEDQVPCDAIHVSVTRKKLSPAAGMAYETLEARTSAATGATLYFHSGEFSLPSIRRKSAAQSGSLVSRNRSSRRITEEEFALLSAREITTSVESHVTFFHELRQWTLCKVREPASKEGIVFLRMTCGEDALELCPSWIKPFACDAE